MKKSSEPTKINERPLQALRILARNDVTVVEVARLMGITRHTAKNHLAVARKAFKTKTTIGAIMAAIREGLINIE